MDLYEKYIYTDKPLLFKVRSKDVVENDEVYKTISGHASPQNEKKHKKEILTLF